MNKKVFIIGEVGINHMGDIEIAKSMIESLKECGADAAKFQSYRAEDRVSTNHNIYDLLKSCELNFEQQTELKCHADKVGIDFISTPFSEEMLSFLVDRLGLRVIKLASFDVTNKEFLRTVDEYARNLPSLSVILSTGMANTKEIYIAMDCLRSVKHLALLHCVSSYPTKESDVNLATIGVLKNLTKVVGYSDHTNDILAPTLSVLAGATIVEKHFTLDLNNGAVDNPVSADPKMMKTMVDVIRLHESMMGDGTIGLHSSEHAALDFRRST